MKISQLLVLFSLIISQSFASTIGESSGITYHAANIEEAKALAGSIGKLAFIEFYADWCGPCKWMDQTTFSNPKVSEYLNENFVSVKINIDDFDGYSAKEDYNVTSLPTMLIFNSKGSLVERIEETLAPSKLMNILSTHNHKANKVVIRHKLNSSPRTSTTSSSKRIYRSPDNRATKPYREYAPPTPITKSAHRVLVGTFRNKIGAGNYHNVLKQTFIDPIFIVKDVVASHVVYKVYMGEFQTRSEAEDYQRILATQFNIKGSVD